MTWGQIRINLLQSSPGVPLDLIDEWINSRYGQILESTDWIGLKAHTSILTTAAYQSGSDTVAIISGTGTVVGTGTTWTTTATTGQSFYIPGQNAVYTIEVMSDTVLALDRPYEGIPGDPAGTSYSGLAYVLMQSIYPLPGDCRSITTVLDPRTDLPLTPFTKDGLDAATGTRATLGYPASWAEYDDTPEPKQEDDIIALMPPVVHQIEFFPPPLLAQGFPLEYLREAVGFSGRNLTAGPLPFIANPPTALLAGVRADVALWQEKFPQAAGYEKLYQMEVARLLQVEHAQRRVKTAMRMAPRFTRHRLQRVNRGQSVHGWQSPGGPY
jgi:hypothetical protein